MWPLAKDPSSVGYLASCFQLIRRNAFDYFITTYGIARSYCSTDVTVFRVSETTIYGAKLLFNLLISQSCDIWYVNVMFLLDLITAPLYRATKQCNVC